MTTSTPSNTTTTGDNDTSFREIHSLILDTGPILLNACSPTSLLQKAEVLITLPSVVSEIRDPVSRSRFETIWKPFLTFRTPKPESIKYISDFAKKTGDFAVLSVTDLQVLALAYEVECERNGGDGRLRRVPGQRQTNEVLERREKAEKTSTEKNEVVAQPDRTQPETHQIKEKSLVEIDERIDDTKEHLIPAAEEDEGWTTISKSKKSHTKTMKRFPTKRTKETENPANEKATVSYPDSVEQPVTKSDELPQSSINHGTDEEDAISKHLESTHLIQSDETAASSIPELDPEITTASSDDEDWITPDNLGQHIIDDAHGTIIPPSNTQIPSACATTDFAMQNVLLQLNIYLFSPISLSRIATTKSHVLRCHACFKIVRDMSKQFCPSCGGPNLTRVACSTDSKGVFRVHLKKNWQWNNRGNVFSMSKPEHGSASGKGVKPNLILVEDQKEYERARKMATKIKERDLMDRDYLPGLITGERLGHGGNVKIGAGRGINAKKGSIQKVRN